MSHAALPSNADNAAILEALPYPYLLLARDLTILAANAAYLRITRSQRENVLGRRLFDAFPGNSLDTDNKNRRIVERSIARVLETGEPDTVMYLRYSIARQTPKGPVFDNRYWSIVHTPLLDEQGCATMVIQNTVEVTELYRLKKAAQSNTVVTGDFDLVTQGHLLSQGLRLQANNRTLAEERNRLRHLFKQAPGFIAILHGPELAYDIVNEAYYQLVGHRDLIGRPIRQALTEIEGQGYFELMAQVMATGEPFVGRAMPAQLQRTPGAPLTERLMDFVFQPLFSTDGSVSGIFVQGNDITEQRRAQEALEISNERWKLAIEGAGDGVWDLNLSSNAITYSKRWKEILGYADDELADTYDTWAARIHPDDCAAVAAALQDCIAGQPYHSEHRLRCKDGHWKWVLARAVVVGRGDTGAPTRIAGTLSDISRKKESDDMIWHHASFDSLTGLPNRRLFRDRLQQEVRKAQRSGAVLGLLFIDLDRFKQVNDLLGHDAGDQLLRQAGLRLSECIRGCDTAARLGGDEFTVILTELNDQAHVEDIVQKIISVLVQPFYLNGEAAHISASIGITLYPGDGNDPETLIRNADQAMYAAKAAGRNQFSYFTKAMQELAHDRVRLIRDLRRALPEGELEVLYQPIVDLASHRIVKAEALLRWHHPQHVPVPPSYFIPLAEEAGLIHAFGDWVFRDALYWSKRWRVGTGQPFQVSVNRSPAEFMSSANGTDWSNALAEIGLPGTSISVEITEGMLLNASPGVATTLLQYRDAGIQVALDDFGTGYSSMAYLKKFDIDYLKIDQSFVRDLEADAVSRAIAESIIMMAHRLGLKVIAEGIETVGQEQILRAAGCDYGQGFLFSQAVKPAALERMLMRESRLPVP